MFIYKKQYHAEHYFMGPSNENIHEKRWVQARKREERESNKRKKMKLEHTVARIETTIRICNDVKQHPNHYFWVLCFQRFIVFVLMHSKKEKEKKNEFKFEQGKVTIMNNREKKTTIVNFTDHELMQQQIKYFSLAITQAKM